MLHEVTGIKQLNNKNTRAHSLHLADFRQQPGKTPIQVQRSKHVASCSKHKQTVYQQVVSSKSEWRNGAQYY